MLVSGTSSAQTSGQMPAQSNQVAGHSEVPAAADSDASLPDAPEPAEPAFVQEPNTPKEKDSTRKEDCGKPPCVPPIINWYLRFENGPQVKPLTPKEKAWLATKNVIDPFNMITIVGEAGISVAADPHSAYGPGWPGFGRYVGVSFSQDVTGEFFGAFLIPSIAHQDPHYHRMPKATYPRRVRHAVTQVIWTQGDDGQAIDDEIGNLYVPGRRTNASSTAQRYVIGLATAPIDNIITEFLPDVARHIHVQIVVVQRIINMVASKDNGS
jgi:hypothetical protein